MRECRFFPWCSYIEDHGCTKDSCRHYQPMPDVGALLALEDEIVAIAGTYPKKGSTSPLLLRFALRIREALGVVEE